MGVSRNMRCLASLTACALAACNLVISNPNAPDTDRVLASESENLLGTQYLRWHFALYFNLVNVWGMAAGQSFENYSNFFNGCMLNREGIPRAPNANNFGNACANEQYNAYGIHSEVMRNTSNILAKLSDTLGIRRFTLGSPARDARARAFAEFLRGLSIGYLALIYDSAAVVNERTDRQDPGRLVGYRVAMDSALAGLGRAIDAASTAPSGPNGFPLPPAWIPGPTSLTAGEFIRLTRSYRARFRAGVARSPAERSAVNWDLVIDDARNGITSDHFNTTNSVSGPRNAWVGTWHTFTGWHQMPPFVLGMADGSDGAYAAWIALPLAARGAGGSFFMVSPDLRFPQGASRDAQQNDFAISSCSGARSVCRRYYVNRATGSDVTPSDSWGGSNYDFVRFYPWRTSGDGGSPQNGNFPFFTRSELDLLEAEGQYRKGNYATAAALVNLTRVGHGGLPPITASDPATPVPGGADCVPKVPVNAGPAGGGTVTCGTLLEAIKYEKRIETQFTHFAGWFIDMRGWGDLPEGTPVHWPVPFQELLARYGASAVLYHTGGGVNPGSAPRGTYGW